MVTRVGPNEVQILPYDDIASATSRMIGLLGGIVTLLLHALTAWRYGYFRDELYFIVCGRHLAWGYVDQPPLVAVAAWLAQPFGDALLPLRLLPILASALTTIVAVRIARLLGAGRFGQTLTALCVALMPAYLALGNLLTTSSFEGLSWTLVTWTVLRMVLGERGWRIWTMLAVAVAFGLYGKYSMGLLVACVLAGLLFTPERAILRTRRLAYAAILTTLLVAPNLLWQAQHGFPFLAVIAGDAEHRHAFNNGLVLESRDLAANAFVYLGEQALYTNPLAMIVWGAGLVAPFALSSLKRARFISFAYLFLIAAAIALAAKGYYTTGIYATLLAVGSVAVERWRYSARVAVTTAIAFIALVSLPLSLPVLSVQQFIAYAQAFGLTGRNGETPHFVQPLFAEEFGWDRLARDVARVYDTLPPGTREATAIYADTYADAGAIDVFGGRYGLPHAISSQNTYWLWGTRGYDGQTLIAIGASRIDLLKQQYHDCALVRTSTEPLKWIVEGPSPIYFCRGLKQPFDQVWPALRWYGA